MYNIKTGSKSLMKNINTGLIIREIREKGPISRTEISKNLDLGLSTVTKICDEIMGKNLIIDAGEGKSTGGRKPINLVFNNEYGYIIGVKIEKDKVIMSLTDLSPSIIFTENYTYKEKSFFNVVENLLIKGIKDINKKLSQKNGKLLGIGIAVSGIVDHINGKLISSSLLGWQNIDFKKRLEDKFGVNVYLDNDVNCYALAQNCFGKGKNNSNFVCTTIGEGIGAGIIINKRLYRGSIGGAGEIGHMIINVDGNQCYCGQRGCLETYASEDFIINYVEEKMGEHYEIEDIIKMAYDGEENCIEAMKVAGKNIGNALINVIMHYNPEKIIIGGKGIKEKDFIIPHILQVMNKNWFNQIGACNTELEIDELGNEYFIEGAAVLVLSELLEMPIYKGQDTLLDIMI